MDNYFGIHGFGLVPFPRSSSDGEINEESLFAPDPTVDPTFAGLEPLEDAATTTFHVPQHVSQVVQHKFLVQFPPTTSSTADINTLFHMIEHAHHEHPTTTKEAHDADESGDLSDASTTDKENTQPFVPLTESEQSLVYFFEKEACVWDRFTEKYNQVFRLIHNFKKDFICAIKRALRQSKALERAAHNAFSINYMMKMALIDVVEVKYRSKEVILSYEKVTRIIQIRQKLKQKATLRPTEQEYAAAQYDQAGLDAILSSQASSAVMRHRMPGLFPTPDRYQWMIECIDTIFKGQTAPQQNKRARYS